MLTYTLHLSRGHFLPETLRGEGEGSIMLLIFYKHTEPLVAAVSISSVNTNSEQSTWRSVESLLHMQGFENERFLFQLRVNCCNGRTQKGQMQERKGGSPQVQAVFPAKVARAHSVIPLSHQVK